MSVNNSLYTFNENSIYAKKAISIFRRICTISHSTIYFGDKRVHTASLSFVRDNLNFTIQQLLHKTSKIISDKNLANRCMEQELRKLSLRIKLFQKKGFDMPYTLASCKCPVASATKPWILNG